MAKTGSVPQVGSDNPSEPTAYQLTAGGQQHDAQTLTTREPRQRWRILIVRLCGMSGGWGGARERRVSDRCAP